MLILSFLHTRLYLFCLYIHFILNKNIWFTIYGVLSSPKANPLPSCSFEITPPNVWPHDGDIFVAVKAGLLVHKAQGVHELMGNHSNPEAVGALQRHSLSSTTCSKVRPAPGSLIIEVFTH